MPTKHLLIEGIVQGVFFRASARDKAVSLHLNGWVRNTAAGNVEAMVTGNEENITAFVDWCKQGPARAVVTKLTVTDSEETGFSAFEIKKD